MDERLPSPSPAPSGDGCKECLESDGWWLHLRRCVECGHIGCCDSSPSQHARNHWHETKHDIITSFEPDETWFYQWSSDHMLDIPDIEFALPRWHPDSQHGPGPADKVPENWQELLHS